MTLKKSIGFKGRVSECGNGVWGSEWGAEWIERRPILLSAKQSTPSPYGRASTMRVLRGRIKVGEYASMGSWTPSSIVSMKMKKLDDEDEGVWAWSDERGGWRTRRGVGHAHAAKTCHWKRASSTWWLQPYCSCVWEWGHVTGAKQSAQQEKNWRLQPRRFVVSVGIVE